MRLPPHSINLSRSDKPAFVEKQTVGTGRLTAGACGSASAGSFTSPWANERTRRVHRICWCIERRLARGQTLAHAVTYFVWYYAHSVYHCDPSRSLRLSRTTLTRLFYLWKKGGRKPEALTLRYRPARAKLSETKLASFVKCCLVPGTGSYRAGFSRLKNPLVTLSAFQKALPRSARTAITHLFTAERAARRARLSALKNTASATLSWPRVQKANLRTFKAGLKASQQKLKPASEPRHV